ncbi:MAG TPA: GLPGLI family protein [Aequorivita sp.]|nr:GLPGLI family protein [Aequorivita sp.]
MKKTTYLLLPLILFVFQMSYSQEITGIATYKSFAKLDLKMDSTQVSAEMRDQIKQMIKQHTQKEYDLYFNKNEMLFKEKEKLAAPGNKMFENASVSSFGGIGVMYQNLKENLEIHQTEILGKMFLVSDTLQKHEWTLEKETKNIGEYVCFKATRTSVLENKETGENRESVITAWYTPQIPVAGGPSGHGGLPGLILEVQSGDVTFLCNQIILNPKNGVNIAAPKKGQMVSKEEFEAIKEKKLMEMQEQTSFPSNSKTIEIRVGG